MKVALVHDHLAQDGGAEAVLRIFAEMFPDAPIFTLLYEPKNADKYYKNRRIETSIIQRLPGGIKHYQWYMPLMPMAVEFFDFSHYDLVLSDSASFAKGIITSPHTLHIDYCHTPTRYVWSDTHQYIKELKYNKYFKKIISLVLNYIRIWDRQAADRVDVFIANSRTTQIRIKKYYKRNSKIIYPPVEMKEFELAEKVEDYYLIGCRLVPYKRVDIVVEAFKQLGFKLKIFGDGVDEERLRFLAKGYSNIEFLGRVDNQVRKELFSKCLAFIHPQEEDFGITPLEAMASGRPVIAYKKGGVTETVLEGTTGIFFERQKPADIIEAVHKFRQKNFDIQEIRKHAEKFSVDLFKNNISAFIEKEYKQFKEDIDRI
jgi:glycosyltransferase involved in cell wall biosynthesis